MQTGNRTSSNDKCNHVMARHMCVMDVYVIGYHHFLNDNYGKSKIIFTVTWRFNRVLKSCSINIFSRKKGSLLMARVTEIQESRNTALKVHVCIFFSTMTIICRRHWGCDTKGDTIDRMADEKKSLWEVKNEERNSNEIVSRSNYNERQTFVQI